MQKTWIWAHESNWPLLWCFFVLLQFDGHYMLLFGQEQLGCSTKYPSKCSTEEKKSYWFGTTWGLVNNNRTFIFLITKKKKHFFGEIRLFECLAWLWELRGLYVCVFTHFRCRLKKKHKKPLLFVCLLRQTSHRRALFLSGETILCTSNRQTNGTGLLSQFYRYLFTFALFSLSLFCFLSLSFSLPSKNWHGCVPWDRFHLHSERIPICPAAKFLPCFLGTLLCFWNPPMVGAGASLSGPNATNYLKGRHQSDSLQWPFICTREKLTVWVNERLGRGWMSCEYLCGDLKVALR